MWMKMNGLIVGKLELNDSKAYIGKVYAKVKFSFLLYESIQ